MTLVTVIVPAFDDEAHVGAALDSLLGQRDVDLEIVVVDDGSTDGTAGAIAAAAARDPRIRAFRQEVNGGVARARERAVAESRGEWVWFVDSDDAWPDDAVAAMLEVGERTGADVVVAGARFEFSSGKAGRDLPAPGIEGTEPGERALRRLLRGEITGHLWNKLFRRRVLEGIEFVPAKVQSDLPIVAGALAGAATVAALDRTVYTYRVRSGSVITSVARRAESLALIEGAVERAVRAHPGVAGSAEHRYFVGRYIVLSGMKDAVLGGYGPDERVVRLAVARSRISGPVLRTFATGRDWRRLALAASARISLPAYRRLLRVADR